MTNDVTFPKHVHPLPPGYRVVQLDSGHFMWIGPLDAKLGREAEGSINVDKWAVWRGAFAHNARTKGRDRPILWSAPMVLALLAGRKTQTRRIAKFEFFEGQNPEFSGYTPGTYFTGHPHTGYVLRSRGAGGCWNDRTKPLEPYALVGDRLWGRETFAPCEAPIRRGHYQYAADGALGIRVHDTGGNSWWERSGYTVGITRGDPTGCWVGKPSKWKPSIFMPREASRLLHEVTAVRVEPVQYISEEDALAEGIVEAHGHDVPAAMGGNVKLYRWPGGAQTFTSARAAYLAGWDTINGKGSAAKNPWVWVVTFKETKGEIQTSKVPSAAAVTTTPP